MTPKHEAFAREYLVDFNATAAAIRAGYSPKTASQIGYKLLRRPDVTIEIHKARVRATEKSDLQVGRTLSELKAIAFADIGAFVTWDKDGKVTLRPMSEVDPNKLCALAEVREVIGPKGERGVHVKMRDPTPALQLLGKWLGMFVDRGEYRHHVEPQAKVVFTLPANGRRPVGKEG